MLPEIIPEMNYHAAIDARTATPYAYRKVVEVEFDPEELRLLRCDPNSYFLYDALHRQHCPFMQPGVHFQLYDRKAEQFIDTTYVLVSKKNQTYHTIDETDNILNFASLHAQDYLIQFVDNTGLLATLTELEYALLINEGFYTMPGALEHPYFEPGAYFTLFDRSKQDPTSYFAYQVLSHSSTHITYKIVDAAEGLTYDPDETFTLEGDSMDQYLLVFLQLNGN